MLFTFDHNEKMVSRTVELDDEDASIPVPEGLQDAVVFDSEMELLTLLSDGERSILFRSSISNPQSPKIRLDWETLTTAGISPQTHVTYWVTIPTKVDEICFTEGEIVLSDGVSGDVGDPTGGTWLFVADTELRKSADDAYVRGGVTLKKALYQRYIDYTGKQDLRVRVTNGGEQTTFTGNVHKDRKKVNVKKGVREELGVSKSNRRVQVWLDTKAITRDGDDTPPLQTDEGAEGKSGHKEHTVTSGSDTISQSANSIPDGGGSVSDEQPDTSHPPHNESGNHGRSGETVTTEPEDHTTSTDTDTVTASAIEASVNPDFIPVVLLDDDERTQEDWQAHYMRPDGSLLCEKEYSGMVKDPEGDHYSDVCRACALSEPGGIPDRDLAYLLGDETGINFTDQLPFVIDRLDAARLFVQLQSQSQE